MNSKPMHETDCQEILPWGKILDRVNYTVMQHNEYQLGKSQTTVDFEDMGDFAERLGGLFQALKSGLDEARLDIRHMNLLILPYHKKREGQLTTTQTLLYR